MTTSRHFNQRFPEHHLRHSARDPEQNTDLFAVDPVRRSAIAVLICIVTLVAPYAAGPEFGTAMLIAVGWLALTGALFCGPILIWSVGEELVAIVRRRMHPPLEQLDLTPRILHILRRHGYQTIHDVHQEVDTSLLILSNMESRDLQLIRRAINLWKYARWQEQGFPSSGYD